MLFSSMTTSMQLAEECLRQEPTEGEQRVTDAAQQFEGVELFAKTIEAGTNIQAVCWERVEICLDLKWSISSVLFLLILVSQ